MLPIETGEYTFRWDGIEYSITGFLSEGWQKILDESGGWYEPDLLGAIRERYGTGGHYVDFGAFIGTHSIFFDKVCKADRVTAIEPHPAAFGLLYNNLSRNRCSSVDPLQCAAGKAKGRTMLELIGKNWGCVTALPTDELEGTIPIIKATDLITVPPKLIKIDCENATFDVLAGCMDVVSEHRPVLVMELTSEDAYYRAADILTPLDYRLVGQYCHTPTFIMEYAK